MQAIGKRLTYANVVSTLALFLVLAGGAAYAAKVAKKSVGPSQLKANAVTTAKIKANAVTTRKIKKNAVANGKIKDGAVESAKIADGSVTRTDLAEATMPFSRIVFETRGNSTVQLESDKPALYPLANATYTQEAGRDDTVMGALDVSFKPTCTKPRQVQAYILADAAKPTELPTLPELIAPNEAVATGQLGDETGEVAGGRIKLGSYGGLFQPATATSHTLSIVAILHCNTGNGATASFGAADVIGTKK
jgi:hypothetical protein